MEEPDPDEASDFGEVRLRRRRTEPLMRLPGTIKSPLPIQTQIPFWMQSVPTRKSGAGEIVEKNHEQAKTQQK